MTLKKILLPLSLLLLGAPLAARADDNCGGQTVNIQALQDDSGGGDPAELYLNYNAGSDTYCALMPLNARRKGKSTDGYLRYVFCDAGLNSSGNCKGNESIGQHQDGGPRTVQFGPLRVAGNNRCLYASGAVSYTDGSGALHGAYARTSWFCGKGKQY